MLKRCFLGLNEQYKICTVLTISFLASCSLSPVISNELSPGKYQLRAHGNTFSNREELQRNMDAKAKKVCGHDDYTYEDSGENEVLANQAYSDRLAYL